MPLTKAQAIKLKGAIPKNIDDRINANRPKEKWGVLGNYSSYNELRDNLIALRKMSLNRKTCVVQVEGKDVRVYPSSEKNITADVYDIFARGIDSARAVTEILYCSPASMDSLMVSSNTALGQLTCLFNKYQSNMKIHDDNTDKKKGMENAREELARFNGALVDLLVKKNVVVSKSEAIQAINFVRDFLWKKDLCMPICIMEEIKDKLMLRYAEPMEFTERFQNLKNGQEVDFWDKAQPWRAKLASAVGAGPWFDTFMNNNKEVLKKQSSTPMSRYSPNPANAFDCTDILFENDNLIQLSAHERVAITEPLSVGGTKSRQEITDWNHLQLVTKARLQAGINSFMEKWGLIIDQDSPIKYTILHQTLIGDEVTFTPDQSKARASKIQASVIDSKTMANATVRQMLEKETIVRNKKSGEIQFLGKTDKIPEGYQKITVDLLETNNGINMWSARTRIRNNDYNDARKLIGSAVNMFAKVPGSSSNTDWKTIIDFLNSSDHSLLTPFKLRGKKVKDAVKSLTNDLRNEKGDFTKLSREVRENIALSVQAAVELKCTVHETWFGSARRIVANFTRDYVRPIPLVGPLIDWAVRGTMTAAALGLKTLAGVVTFPFSLPQWMKHLGYRREIAKSTYEGILAENLGTLMGGCMSSADRALEQAEQRAMMRKQFAVEGTILSYNDSQKEKTRVYKDYGTTKYKHDCAENATGTAGTSDDETRGIFLNARADVLSHVAENEEEQLLAKDLSKLRKGEYAKATAQDYLGSKLVEGEAKSPAKILTVDSFLPNPSRILETPQNPPKPDSVDPESCELSQRRP